MKKNVLKALFLATAVAIGMASCSKKEEDEATPAVKPATESKKAVTENKTEVAAISANIKSDPGNQASDNFTKYNAGFKLSASRVSYYKKHGAEGFIKATKIASIVTRSVKRSAARLSNEEPDYETEKGYYAYNFDKKDFVLDNTKSKEKLVFAFPATEADEAAKKNTAEFIFNTFDVNEEGSPVNFDAEIKVDGKSVYSLKVSGTYETNGEPKSFDYTETFGTYQQVLTIANTETLQKFSAYYKEKGANGAYANVLGMSFEITMGASTHSAGDDDHEEGGTPEKIAVNVLLSDISVEMTIDFKGFMSEFMSAVTAAGTNPNQEVDSTALQATVDKHIKVTVKESATGVLLGTSKLDLSTGDFVIVYTDGTTESMDDLFKSLEEVDLNVGEAFGGLGDVFGGGGDDNGDFDDDFDGGNSGTETGDNFGTFPGGDFDTTSGDNFGTFDGDNFGTETGGNFGTFPGADFSTVDGDAFGNPNTTFTGN